MTRVNRLPDVERLRWRLGGASRHDVRKNLG
jgi:hypothetical protein